MAAVAAPDMHRHRSATRVAHVALFALLALLAFAWQGSRGLFDPDEGRYTAVALQMLESGDWLVPRLSDHQEHLTKPPLYYWAVATSIAAFGANEWSVRLPNALAFLLTGFAVLALGQVFVPRRPWLPAFLWGTSLMSVLGANLATTDTMLALFETLTVLCFVRAERAGDARGWFVAMWASAGLAFLTKGPPGLLPMLALVAWRIVAGRPVRALFPWQGLVAFAFGGIAWFVWLVCVHPNLLSYFAGYEFVDRVFTARHGRHPQWYGPIVVYVPALALATLPWWLLSRRWVATLAALPRVRYWRALAQRRPARAFLQLWIVLPLLVLCLARSRGMLYILPLVVPLSLAFARSLAVPRFARSRAAVAVLAGWALLVLAGKWFVAFQLDYPKDARVLARELAPALADGPRRILFLDETPSFGLRLYTGLSVEEVRSPGRTGPEGDVFVVHALCDDLALATAPVLVLQNGDAASALPGCPGGTWARVRNAGAWRAGTWRPATRRDTN